MIIEVYTKPACPLCEDGADLVDDVAASLGVTVLRRNILEREEWFRRYRYLVPVLAVDGVDRLELRFDEPAVRAALSGAGPP